MQKGLGFLSLLVLCTASVNAISVKTWAGGGAVIGDGAPTHNEPQTLLKDLPVETEMERLIANLERYDFYLSRDLGLLLRFCQERRYDRIRISKPSPGFPATFEAETASYNGTTTFENISFYFWDNFFELPLVDEANPNRHTQVKALLREFLQIVAEMPPSEIQNLTDLVYRASLGMASTEEFRQLDQNVDVTYRQLRGQPIVYHPVGDFLREHEISMGPARIATIPESWIESYEHGTPAARERISKTVGQVWLLWQSDANASFFMTAHTSGPSLQERLQRWLAFEGYRNSSSYQDSSWIQYCHLGPPTQELIGPETLSVFLHLGFTGDTDKISTTQAGFETGGIPEYYAFKTNHHETCTLSVSDFDYAEALNQAIERFKKIPPSPDLLPHFPSWLKEMTEANGVLIGTQESLIATSPAAVRKIFSGFGKLREEQINEFGVYAKDFTVNWDDLYKRLGCPIDKGCKGTGTLEFRTNGSVRIHVGTKVIETPSGTFPGEDKPFNWMIKRVIETHWKDGQK